MKKNTPQQKNNLVEEAAEKLARILILQIQMEKMKNAEAHKQNEKEA